MRRLLGPIGDVPPAEFEEQYYAQTAVAGVNEFSLRRSRYDSPQFWAGLVGSPAGLLGTAGGTALWRHGLAARQFVVVAAVALLSGTAFATAFDVMGPPATIIGLAGALPPLVWAWRLRVL